jgi:hypothetical protein
MTNASAPGRAGAGEEQYGDRHRAGEGENQKVVLNAAVSPAAVCGCEVS